MQECIFNQALDYNCYGTEQGGNIQIQLFKPTYAMSQYKQCTAATAKVLFISQITLTSYLAPTPHPTLGPTLGTSVVGLGVQAPFYIVFIFIVSCILFGVVLVRLRDSTDHLVPLRLTRTCTTLSLFGNTFTAEMAFVGALLHYSREHTSNHNVKAFAALILIARFFHLPGGFYIAKNLLGNDVEGNHYLSLVDRDHLYTNLPLYGILMISNFLDNSNVAFLPWLSAKFSCLSDGYPDLQMYKGCILVKLSQSFTTVIVQICAIATLNSEQGAFRNLERNTQVFLCISLVSSTITFLITFVGLLLQMRLLKAITDDTDDGTSFDINKPINNNLRIGDTSSRFNTIGGDNNISTTIVNALKEDIQIIKNQNRVLNEENIVFRDENKVLSEEVKALTMELDTLKSDMSSEIELLKNQIKIMGQNRNSGYV